MKQQLVLFLNDICKNKVYFVWNLIQISIVCLLLSFIILSVFRYSDVKNKLSKMTVHSEIYMFKDETSQQKSDELLNDESMLPDLVQLYKFLQKKIVNSTCNVLSFTADSTRQFYLANELVEKFQKELHNQEYDSVDMISISKNFLEVYDLKCEGDIKKFEKISDEITPIIVGNDFRRMFHLYDTIYDYSGEKYEIVGFLDKNSYYIAPDKTREPIYLSKSILKLSEVDMNDSMELLNYFTSTYYIAKDSSFMEEVIEQSKKAGLLSLSINNFTYQMNAITADMKDQIILNGSIMVILFAFCLIAMTGNILQFISNGKKEFAIHMMCGASGRRIRFRVIMQMWCMYLGAVVITLIIAGGSKAVFLSLAIFAVYIGLLQFIPILILKQQSIQMMLRKSYE